jgi:hypothetical protein
MGSHPRRRVGRCLNDGSDDFSGEALAEADDGVAGVGGYFVDTWVAKRKESEGSQSQSEEISHSSWARRRADGGAGTGEVLREEDVDGFSKVEVVQVGEDGEGGGTAWCGGGEATGGGDGLRLDGWKNRAFFLGWRDWVAARKRGLIPVNLVEPKRAEQTTATLWSSMWFLTGSVRGVNGKREEDGREMMSWAILMGSLPTLVSPNFWTIHLAEGSAPFGHRDGYVGE